MKPTWNIAFVHPDLGIGGAERLIVDAATQLQAAGHRTTIFTAHHDPSRCLDETRDGTLRVRAYGRIPVHINGHLRVPSAIARMSYLAAALALGAERFDIVFCDLVAQVVPLLRLLQRARIVFYCHFPDRLLAPPGGRLYRAYRLPLDAWEQAGVGMADRVLVNSHYTASMLHRAFPRLRRVDPEVVYPGVQIRCDDDETKSGHEVDPGLRTILSMARFEPGKNVALAIDAFALLRGKIRAERFAPLRLVIAGGYDDRLEENRTTLASLQQRAASLGIAPQVRFVRSPSDSERRELVESCACAVHTALNEHFGYAPVEAMAARRPVVAVNRGGPAETVVDGETGFLRAATPEAFAEALGQLLEDPERARRMGEAGRARVAERFSRAAFGARLEQVMQEVIDGRVLHRDRALG